MGRGLDCWEILRWSGDHRILGNSIRYYYQLLLFDPIYTYQFLCVLCFLSEEILWGYTENIFKTQTLLVTKKKYASANIKIS